MKSIYIAGPMQGVRNFNYPHFDEVASALRLGGWRVENPVEIGNRFGTAKQIAADRDLLAKVIEAELDAVSKCDAIYLLKGWHNSPGAKAELAVAIKNGAQIVLEREGVYGR